MKELTARIGSVQNGYILMNPVDAQNEEIIDGDIVVIEEPITGVRAYAFAQLSDGVPVGIVKINEITMRSLGISDDFPVNIWRFEKTTKPIEYIKFIVTPSFSIENNDYDLVLDQLNAAKDKIDKAIENSIIFKDFEFEVDGIILKVAETIPQLSIDEVGRITDVFAGYAFTFEAGVIPFNGVLLIDLSGSMRTKDIKVKEFKGTFSMIKDFSTSPRFIKFIEGLEGNYNISRADAAVLAVLVFLYEKGARGYGEKMVIIPFRNKPLPIEFNPSSQKKHVLDFSKDQINDKIVEMIIDTTSQVMFGTRMCDALKTAIAIIKEELGEKQPTMILLLTDGRPNNKKCVKNFAANVISKMNNVVLYSIGIGSEKEINIELMKEISSLCRGEFVHAKSLNELVRWYQSLARDFTIKIQKSTTQQKGQKNE